MMMVCVVTSLVLDECTKSSARVDYEPHRTGFSESEWATMRNGPLMTSLYWMSKVCLDDWHEKTVLCHKVIPHHCEFHTGAGFLSPLFKTHNRIYTVEPALSNWFQLRCCIFTIIYLYYTSTCLVRWTSRHSASHTSIRPVACWLELQVKLHWLCVDRWFWPTSPTIIEKHIPIFSTVCSQTCSYQLPGKTAYWSHGKVVS